jgi:hypothetical protein
MGRIAALSLVAVLALSCKDEKAEAERVEKARAAEAASKKEALDKFAPAARAKINLARKVSDELSKVPRAEEGQKPPVTDPKLRLLELHDDADANADLMLASELPLFQRAVLGSCRYNDLDGWKDMVSSTVEGALKRCARVRFFLVVRSDVKVDPKLAGGSKYTGGAFAGDVVVYDLANDPPSVVGTFPIEVVMTKSVKVGATASKDLQEYELNEALRKELLHAVEKATN